MTKLISLSILLALCIGLGAQELIVERDLEAAHFLLLVPYDKLNFRQDADEVEYQLSIDIRNSRNRTVLSQNLRETFSKRDWLRGSALPIRFSRQLDPGSYRAQIRLRNRSLGGSLDLERRFALEEDYQERGEAFVFAEKDGIRFLPPSADNLHQMADLAVINLRFTTQFDSIRVYADNRYFTLRRPSSPLELNIMPLLENGQENALRLVIYEENIIYKMDAFLYSQWFAYGQNYSLSDQMAQIRYVASQNEWQYLREVPDDDMASAIEEFWRSYDPSPGTARNEAREQFYQRVMIADERYTIHSRLKGWRSDRGRIFIKYGEPDEVRAEVHPLDSDPYIIWQYYQQNLSFVFTDSGGFGLYQLRNRDEEY